MIELCKFFQEHKSIIIQKDGFNHLLTNFPKLKFMFKRYRNKYNDDTTFQRIKETINI